MSWLRRFVANRRKGQSLDGANLGRRSTDNTDALQAASDLDDARRRLSALKAQSRALRRRSSP